MCHVSTRDTRRAVGCHVSHPLAHLTLAWRLRTGSGTSRTSDKVTVDTTFFRSLDLEVNEMTL